jgi:hypothetical protein
MPPSGDEETVVCLICRRVIIVLRQEDGTVTLPDAAAFRRDHHACLERSRSSNARD